LDKTFPDGFSFQVTFLVDEDVVRTIVVYPTEGDGYDWLSFSTGALLRQYGVPSLVGFAIETSHEPSDTPWMARYDMSIVFEDYDLYVEYWWADTRLDQPMVACPDRDFPAATRVYLGDLPGWQLGYTYDTPIEQAASLTLEEFHDYVVQGPGACFSLIPENIVFP